MRLLQKTRCLVCTLQGQLDQAFIHLMKFCNLAMKYVNES